MCGHAIKCHDDGNVEKLAERKIAMLSTKCVQYSWQEYEIVLERMPLPLLVKLKSSTQVISMST